MGIKNYITDLMTHLQSRELPQKFIDNNFYYDQYQKCLKNPSTYSKLAAIKETTNLETFLVLYMTEKDNSGEWEDLGYYFVFHKDKIELVENDKEGFNLYETSVTRYLCNNKDEYFNLSIKFDLKLNFELIQFIHNKFNELNDGGKIKKYIIYYGIGEEVDYGYNN